ncbi:hypothetical protein Cflav_PD4511 [Pedosphaera parvula Ellin514]|uniref:Uncharacterized protein n=1 Tax=Pedosphaera parvula (strain Ellin514) TaxID=320771 RepID=B9XDV7_PEDPL|nr:hypothetical protein Cflav_PD4511 [Pedosphaera parvula Ellin514]
MYFFVKGDKTFGDSFFSDSLEFLKSHFVPAFFELLRILHQYPPQVLLLLALGCRKCSDSHFQLPAQPRTGSLP